MKEINLSLTAEQIIRNFNLYLLSGIELEEPLLSMYNDLDFIFSDLYEYKSYDEYYKNTSYYLSSKKDMYFIYSASINEITVEHHNVHGKFDNKYSHIIKGGVQEDNVNEMYGDVGTRKLYSWIIKHKFNINGKLIIMPIFQFSHPNNWYKVK